MAEPFISQITMFGFDFPPRTWAKCDGTLISINNNPALYALLGLNFGGDGRTNFGLPELRGRVPIHRGNGYNIGEKGGSETVRLSNSQLPEHSHQAQANSQPGDTNLPEGKVLAMAPSGNPIYTVAANPRPMGAALSSTGSGGAHTNMQPSQVINFCIALAGDFPPRN
ncbi:phage tail protein [Motiliproteus sp. MSK22-1]|uniref:phage tail protein n=1 Tax=Motiliproteus sp. MSK22-1 TaxID=1897630 RepID=UPI000978BBB5|nr:tail fiber protein [Motiliproteus sp. MSK22-1]OMH33804.1 hypothetical protein BGP75_12510 [Motiliproteus sp. MSK22-1]